LLSINDNELFVDLSSYAFYRDIDIECDYYA